MIRRSEWLVSLTEDEGQALIDFALYKALDAARAPVTKKFTTSQRDTACKALSVLTAIRSELNLKFEKPS